MSTELVERLHGALDEASLFSIVNNGGTYDLLTIVELLFMFDTEVLDLAIIVGANHWNEGFLLKKTHGVGELIG